MGRLTRITFGFPERDEGAASFLAAFGALLTRVPGVAHDGSTLHFSPQWPLGALPTTTLTLAPTAVPEVVFGMDRSLDLTLGTLHLRSAGDRARSQTSPGTDPAEQLRTLPLTTIVEHLAGRITGIDHSGVNLPLGRVDGEGWSGLLRGLAEEANLYRYPDGAPWPFVIPATDAEFADDIREFGRGRSPKFELVHDRWAPCPVLQFALVTDLSREELEARFPEPFGVAFPDLGHLFRTVFIEHPWQGLLIRLDLSYRGPVTDWDTGEWLVTAGGRLR